MAKELKKLRASFEYEVERLPFTLVLKRTYLPDFKLKNGIYIETKGLFTSADRRKLMALREQSPEKDIRLVFQRDNKLSKKSSTRYSAWCEKYGFKYAVGYIPREWIKEKKA